MKRNFFQAGSVGSLLLAVVLGFGLSTRIFGQFTNSGSEDVFVYAVEKRLFSQYLMEERKVYVSLPDSYDSSNDKSYPVVFVTDGDGHLHHLSGIMSFLSGNEKMPEAILVAIPHKNRNSDLLPQANLSGNASGNALNFMAFIQYELIPALDQEYRTQPFKVLAGHSYGGLFTTWAMLSNSRSVFNAYIAADPSLWWDGRRLINEARTLFANEPNYGPYYYFDQSDIANMGGTNMAEMLEDLGSTSLQWKFVRMQEEQHNTIVHKSYYNGLEFVFEDWPYNAVSMNPEGGLFMPGESIELTLSHPRADEGVIRYTTDGSNPTGNSAIYSEPLRITTNTNIRASLFLGNNRNSPPVKGSFAEAVMQGAMDPAHELNPGLNYQFYSGKWEVLPDFSLIQAVETGVKVGVDLYQWRGIDDFALRYSGYFLAESNGIYGFSLSSDDGSRLLIDGIEIINNDGLHSDEEKKGWMWLEDGYHQFELEYFELGGEESLNLIYQRPGYAHFWLIPSRLFFH